ncbi:MAG TPA: hypothetical protein PLP83_02630 [Candidatus Aminicenantes bacterium]|nr:hypothetical protein [Candidatus Aminicenantes bacterium]
MKKTLALAVGFLVLGLAFATGQDQTAAKAREKAQVQTGLKAEGGTRRNKVQAKPEFRRRNRVAFIDENGDGINDLARDHDGDGIPNGQDPDWARPQDGTGYKGQNRNGQPDEAGMTKGLKAGQAVKSSFGKGSFRAGMQGAARQAGAGVCDGTGPKGTAQRKGRR